MKISLRNISKKFGKSFIFRNVSFDFEEGKSYAIVGSNGSGKSTLLKIIAGYITPASGEVIYGNADAENIYQKIAYCAPYLDVVEEMTLPELLQFHASFKSFLPGIDAGFVCALLGFDIDKLIKDYSSGMRQRVKLALAFFFQTDIILLDEPTSNLDVKGVEWYVELVSKYKGNRTLLVASNDLREYEFCSEILEIERYK
jgi:ABC-type multidrug transport system ATPase subunit